MKTNFLHNIFETVRKAVHPSPEEIAAAETKASIHHLESQLFHAERGFETDYMNSIYYGAAFGMGVVVTPVYDLIPLSATRQNEIVAESTQKLLDLGVSPARLAAIKAAALRNEVSPPAPTLD